MNIHNMIVQAIHTAMEYGFNLDIDIKEWDRYQQTLEGIIDDNCFYVEGTSLGLDSPEWQEDLALINEWLSKTLNSESFKQLQTVMDKRWSKYTKTKVEE